MDLLDGPPPWTSTSARTWPNVREGAGGLPLEALLHRADELRTELGGVDDSVDRADLHRAPDAVRAVELRGDFTELLGPHRGADVVQLGGQRGSLGPGRVVHPPLQ